MIVLPLETSLPDEELGSNDSDVIYIGQIDCRTDSQWFIFGVLVFNQKVHFFRSSKADAHVLLEFQSAEDVDGRWNNLSRVVCLKMHLKGAFFAGWNKGSFYIMDLTADPEFHTEFIPLDCGVFLPLTVCRVSETRVNEFLVVGQRGHFSIIQIGFRNYAIKLASQLIVPGAKITSALLYDSLLIALVVNDVIVFNCQSKSIVMRSMLPGSDFISMAIVQNKLLVLARETLFAMSIKFSKSENGASIVPFDWGEELYFLEDAVNVKTQKESLNVSKWSHTPINMEDLVNFAVFENCVYLWNREKVAILEVERFTCVREIELHSIQIPLPCPSVQGIAIIERGKIKVVISGVASGSLLEKIVNFSGISALDRFTDLNSEAKAGLPGYKLPKNVLDTQNDLIGYFLDRWRVYFEEHSSLDLDSEEISSNYLSAIDQICNEICGSNLIGTNPETKALLCLFLKHLIHVFKCLNEKSRKNSNWKGILTEVGQCLRRLRSGVGFIEKIRAKQSALNQSFPDEGLQKKERSSRISMNTVAVFSYDAFSAQKAACKNAAEMLIKETDKADIVYCLRKVDLQPDEIISRLRQRSFKVPVLRMALEDKIEGDDNTIKNLKAGIEEKSLSHFEDSQTGMYSFSISSLSRMSAESALDFNSALKYSKNDLSTYEDFMFALKFSLGSTLANVINCSNLDLQQAFDSTMTSEFRESVFEVLNCIYLTEKFKFSEMFRNLRFSNIYNRMLFPDADGDNKQLVEICKFLASKELIFEDALLSLLPLIDVYALSLSDSNLDLRVRQIVNVFFTSHAHGDVISFGRSFIDSKKLWDEQNNKNEVGDLSDLALLVFWGLLDWETKEMFERKCIEASKPFEKLHSIMTNNYPTVITSTVYDLLEGNSYLRCDTLFLWQISNKYREINLPSTATYPNFDDVMESGTSSFDCLPSYQHYLMHGRPAFAFQMILAHWSSLEESQQRRYRSRCIDNIRSIACKNVDNSVIVASAVALLLMMGESTTYLRSRVQLLKFMAQNRRQMCPGTSKTLLNFVYFTIVSKVMVSKYSIAKRKSTDQTFMSARETIDSEQPPLDFIQFLDQSSFLSLFNTMLEYFPIIDLIKDNNKSYFTNWVDILVFCHKFGFSIKQLLSLLIQLEDSALKEHLQLCFMKNYKTLSQQLVASQKKHSTVASMNSRSKFVSKALQPSISRETSVESELGQSMSVSFAPSRSGASKHYASKEDVDSQSSVTSSDGGKSTLSSMFVNFSSALRVIKPSSGLKICHALSKCKKPILMAACFHSIRDFTPEIFMGHYLNSSGQNLGSKGHQKASVLTKVALPTLTLGVKITSLRRDCEPLESTHFTDELMQCLLAIPDMEKCLGLFEGFVESLYLEYGTLIEEFKNSSEDVTSLPFLDELFESCVKYFRNIEFQKKCVIAFAPLKEFLRNYGLANLYILMYDTRIPFHFKLDMRQDFPDRAKVGKLVHAVITEKMSRGMTDEAVDLLKLALAEDLDFSHLLMDLEFSTLKSEIVLACSHQVRELFFEAMLTYKVATYGMGLNSMAKHMMTQNDLSITELTLLLTMDLQLSESMDKQLQAHTLQKYVNLCYDDSNPTNSEKALDIYDSLLLQKFSLFTKMNTLMAALENQPLVEYLQVRRGMSDQLFSNLVNEFIRRQSFDLAITICVFYGKSLPAIRFVIASLLLLEDKISLADFSRFMDLRLVSNNQQPVNNLITSMCAQYYPNCAPFMRMYCEYDQWNKMLKRTGNDDHSTILKCLESEYYNLLHDLVTSGVISGEMLDKCCLQFMFSYYETRERDRNCTINSKFDNLLELLPNKQLLMEKMCRLSFDLLKSQQYYAAVSLMYHVLVLLGNTFHLSTVRKFEAISTNLAAVLRANFDYNLAVHCLKCLTKDKVMCCQIIQLMALRRTLTHFIDNHHEIAMELRNLVVPHLLQKEMTQSKQYLKRLNFVQEYAKLLRDRAGSNVKFRFSVTMGTNEAASILAEVARDYFEAYNCFNQDKKFSEAQYCLKQANLCGLQIKLLPETIAVMNLESAPEITFFHILDKLSHVVQILTFLEAYDKVSVLLPRFLCEKVIIGGDFQMLTHMNNYFTFSISMIREVQQVVRLKQKEARGDEAAVKKMKANWKEIVKRVSKNRNVGKILQAK